MLRQCIVRVGGVPDTERVTRRTVKTAAGQEVLTDSGLRGGELLNEILLGGLVGFEDAGSSGHIALRPAIFIRECVIDLFGHALD